MKLSAIVLTRNEEANIRECFEALRFADEILVVDSGSKDSTVPEAEACGARVVFHPFADFSSQRNFAMSQAKGDWVLFIDADERVTPSLAMEIKAAIQGSPCVYTIPFRTYFFGKRLRFGDAYGEWHARLLPRLKVSWLQPVHEQIVTDLPWRKLKNPVIHYTTRDLAHYMTKAESYIPREISVMKMKNVRPSLFKAFLIPPAKFCQLYFGKLGILDGIAGFQYAILSAYFYTFQKHWLYWKQR